MRIFYEIAHPSFIFSSGATNCNLPSAPSAIRIIPFDSMFFNFRGCRFTNTHTCRPTHSSGVKCSAIPDTIVRVSIPTFTVSFISLSVFGTRSAAKIVPTRISIFAKSSYTIVSFCGATGAFKASSASRAAFAAFNFSEQQFRLSYFFSFLH